MHLFSQNTEKTGKPILCEMLDGCISMTHWSVWMFSENGDKWNTSKSWMNWIVFLNHSFWTRTWITHYKVLTAGVYIFLQKEMKTTLSLKGTLWYIREGEKSYQSESWALTVLLRRDWRPSLSVISLIAMAFGRSCLFANRSSTASRSSSSWS